MYIIMAIVAGIAIVISRTVNFKLSSDIGIFQGTLFNYITGLTGSLIILFISKEHLNASFNQLTKLPYWFYLGGLIGVLTVALSSYLTSKISVFYLTIFTFLGQLSAGVIIDMISSSKISIGTIIGGLLVFIGLTYNVRIDKKDASKTK